MQISWPRHKFLDYSNTKILPDKWTSSQSPASRLHAFIRWFLEIWRIYNHIWAGTPHTSLNRGKDTHPVKFPSSVKIDISQFMYGMSRNAYLLRGETSGFISHQFPWCQWILLFKFIVIAIETKITKSRIHWNQGNWY